MLVIMSPIKDMCANFTVLHQHFVVY